MIRWTYLLAVLSFLFALTNSAQAQYGGPPVLYGAGDPTASSVDKRFDETDYLWSQEPVGFNPSLAEKGELLIIHPEEYGRDLLPFFKWKKQRGYLVYGETIESIGNDQDKIQEVINQYYHSSNVRYVVIIGDHDQVVPHRGTVGNSEGKPADPMYALIDQDIYPDLYISRIPVNSAQELRVIINKTIRYEKAEVDDYSWYDQGISIGSDEGGNTYYDLNDDGEKVPYEGEKDRTIAEHLAEQLRSAGYSEVALLFDTDEADAAKSNLIDELNQGAGLVYYLGHGVEYKWKTTQFTNSDIGQLKNYNKTPVIISVACLNGNFEWVEGDSFAENWISAGTEEVGTGAVAILASSTVQPWTPPTVGLKDMVNSISTAKYKTLGGIFTNGVISFLRKKRKEIIDTFQSWHIFGDATIMLRTKAPTEIYYSIDDEFDSLENLQLNAEEGTIISVVQGPYLLARSFDGENWEVLKQLEKNIDIIITLTGRDRLPVELTYKLKNDHYILQDQCLSQKSTL